MRNRFSTRSNKAASAGGVVRSTSFHGRHSSQPRRTISDVEGEQQTEGDIPTNHSSTGVQKQEEIAEQQQQQDGIESEPQFRRAISDVEGEQQAQGDISTTRRNTDTQQREEEQQQQKLQDDDSESGTHLANRETETDSLPLLRLHTHTNIQTYPHVYTYTCKKTRIIVNVHTRPVWSVAFSPDGKTIVSGSDDMQIRLWDVETGEARLGGKALEGFPGWGSSVAFSTDGQSIISRHADDVRMWDAATGEPRSGGNLFERSPTPISANPLFDGSSATRATVILAPVGNLLAGNKSNNSNNNSSIRDSSNIDSNTDMSCTSGVIYTRTTSSGFTDPAKPVAFSPDGKTFASISWSSIYLWNTETREPKLHGKALEGHTNVVRCVSFSPDGKTIASSSRDRTIRLWDVKTGKAKFANKPLKGHALGINTVAFSCDGRTLASGSVDRTIRIWDIRTGKAKKVLVGHTLDINSVAFSPDGNTLVSGSHDLTIRLWDIEADMTALKPASGWTNFIFGV